MNNGHKSIDALLNEIHLLKQRVEELERQNTKLQRLARQHQILQHDYEQLYADAESYRLETEAVRTWMYKLFEQIPVAIALVHGPENTIQFANRFYREIVGDQETDGKQAQEVLPGIRGRRVADILRMVYESGQPELIREMPVWMEGSVAEREVWLDCGWKPTRDSYDQVDGIVYYGIDVTEQVRARQQIEQLNEELEVKIDQYDKSRILLESIVDNSPALIWVKTPKGVFTLVNRHYAAVTGKRQDQIVGVEDYALFRRDIVKVWRDNDLRIIETGEPIRSEEYAPGEGGEAIPTVSVKFPIYDASGGLYGVGGIATDISSFQEAERSHASLQAKMINAQREKLRTAAAPLIALTDYVVVMPLMGDIDSERATHILNRLLEAVSENRTQVVIIDISHTQVEEDTSLSMLIDAAQMVRLLGITVVMTGIGTEIAQRLVKARLPTEGIVTLRNLLHGIEFAMRKQSQWLIP
jgi:rsbT co-antagonist protein RsbR